MNTPTRPPQGRKLSGLLVSVHLIAIAPVMASTESTLPMASLSQVDELRDALSYFDRKLRADQVIQLNSGIHGGTANCEQFAHSFYECRQQQGSAFTAVARSIYSPVINFIRKNPNRTAGDAPLVDFSFPVEHLNIILVLNETKCFSSSQIRSALVPGAAEDLPHRDYIPHYPPGITPPSHLEILSALPRGTRYQTTEGSTLYRIEITERTNNGVAMRPQCAKSIEISHTRWMH
ncbi:hypothetical protein [Inhella inkyongensis]|nr:hypothetical protein [Inhella inkyongensis]